MMSRRAGFPRWSASPMFSAGYQSEEHSHVIGISVYGYELKMSNERNGDRQRSRSKYCSRTGISCSRYEIVMGTPEDEIDCEINIQSEFIIPNKLPTNLHR